MKQRKAFEFGDNVSAGEIIPAGCVNAPFLR